MALGERFSELLAPQGTAVYSMHPGWAETEGLRQGMPGFHALYRSQLRSAEQGADTIVYLALQACFGGWRGGHMGCCMGCCMGG